jgi:hypothetical protein
MGINEEAYRNFQRHVAFSSVEENFFMRRNPEKHPMDANTP